MTLNQNGINLKNLIKHTIYCALIFNTFVGESWGGVNVNASTGSSTRTSFTIEGGENITEESPVRHLL